MSVYNQSYGQIKNADSLEKIRSYLFQNNELLRYMFDNLDPEDNYSDAALKKYIERDKKIATLEFDVNGLQFGLKNLEEYTETKFQLMDRKITLEITNLREETDTKIELLNGKIELKVSKGDVSNQLSVETDGIYIKGQRLKIETDNFTLTQNGTLSCTNANFSGTIKSTSITTSKFNGGTITGSKIRAGLNWDVSNDTCYMLYATDDSLNLGNMHIVEYSGRYILESDDGWVGMSPEVANKSGKVSLWANYHPAESEEYDFVVSQSGNTRIKNLTVYGKIYDDVILGSLQDEYASDGVNWTKIGYNIIRLWHRYSDLESRVSDLEGMI